MKITNTNIDDDFQPQDQAAQVSPAGSAKSDAADETSLCPKRVWTLSVLSDEAPAVPSAVPRGLAFHLKRCPSCRAVAERLMGVRTQMSELASADPALGLLERANDQLRMALAAGAVPRESASWPDDLLLLATQARGRRSRWLIRGGVAAAALVCAVGAGRWWSFYAGASRSAVVHLRAPGEPDPRHDPAIHGPAGVVVAPADDSDPSGVLAANDEGVHGPMEGADGVVSPPGRGRGTEVLSFHRAWVPGRDYGAIIGITMDNER